MYKLKPTGRAAIVLPDGFLFGEGIKTTIKTKLLSEFNLHTIVRLPNGVFSPSSDINTTLLFIEAGKPTSEIWYYQAPLPEGYKKYTKTKPIQNRDFSAIKAWWGNREENEFAWKVEIEQIKSNGYNLDIKNPSTVIEADDIGVDELIEKISESMTTSQTILEQIKEMM